MNRHTLKGLTEVLNNYYIKKEYYAWKQFKSLAMIWMRNRCLKRHVKFVYALASKF